MGNLVVGNYIGTDTTGNNSVSNGMGLEFVNNSSGNTVGGAVSGAGNLVSGNRGDAIKIDGDCQDNVVQGNLVGVNVTGTSCACQLRQRRRHQRQQQHDRRNDDRVGQRPLVKQRRRDRACVQ